MPLWNKEGQRPKYLSSEDRRKVIATPQGWVKRDNITGAVGGGNRSREEILVAIGSLDSEVKMGNPDILEIYVSNSTGGTSLKRNSTNKVNVVFSEPISIGASASPFRLTVANTAGGNTVVATASTNKSNIVNANNTLVFGFVANTAGTYKVQAQSLANTAQAKVYSVYGGTSEVANTVISATVSNALSTFSIT